MKFNFFENLIRGNKQEKQKESTDLDTEETKEKELEKILAKIPEEKILNEGKTEKQKQLCGDRVIFIKIRGNGAGIFKPKGEERDWRKKEKGTHYRRERAAYLVNRFLNLDLVPPTIIRKVKNKGVGSMQQFIEDAKNWHEIDRDERLRVEEQLIKLWLFDYIIWNTDRNMSNYLIKKNKVYAIDNELTFSHINKEVCYWHSSLNYFNKPIPKNIIKIFEKFLVWSQGKEILRDLLQELLNKKETNACIRRIERIGKQLIRQGKINPPKELTFD